MMNAMTTRIGVGIAMCGMKPPMYVKSGLSTFGVAPPLIQ